MSVTLSITEVQLFSALRMFLLGILPSGASVIRAEINRVPEPAGTDFIVMTPIMMPRLSTNIDVYADASLTGSISGTTLTVTAIALGSIVVGAPVYGAGVSTGTSITALGTGMGGVGTYLITPSQTISSETIWAGTQQATQKLQATIQLDVHGPNSANNVNTITTLFRDQYAVDAFQASGIDIAPLYMSDPRQSPFLNGEQQIEFRWTVDAVMQINPVVQVPQQFAAQLDITTVAVEAAYPA